MQVNKPDQNAGTPNFDVCAFEICSLEKLRTMYTDNFDANLTIFSIFSGCVLQFSGCSKIMM